MKKCDGFSTQVKIIVSRFLKKVCKFGVWTKSKLKSISMVCNVISPLLSRISYLYDEVESLQISLILYKFLKKILFYTKSESYTRLDSWLYRISSTRSWLI